MVDPGIAESPLQLDLVRCSRGLLVVHGKGQGQGGAGAVVEALRVGAVGAESCIHRVVEAGIVVAQAVDLGCHLGYRATGKAGGAGVGIAGHDIAVAAVTLRVVDLVGFHIVVVGAEVMADLMGHDDGRQGNVDVLLGDAGGVAIGITEGADIGKAHRGAIEFTA